MDAQGSAIWYFDDGILYREAALKAQVTYLGPSRGPSKGEGSLIPPGHPRGSHGEEDGLAIGEESWKHRERLGALNNSALTAACLSQRQRCSQRLLARSPLAHTLKPCPSCKPSLPYARGAQSACSHTRSHHVGVKPKESLCCRAFPKPLVVIPATTPFQGVATVPPFEARIAFAAPFQRRSSVSFQRASPSVSGQGASSASSLFPQGALSAGRFKIHPQCVISRRILSG